MRFFLLFAFFALFISAGFMTQKLYRFAASYESQKAAVFTNDSNIVDLDPSVVNGGSSNTAADDEDDADSSDDADVTVVFPDDTQPNDDTVIVLNDPTTTPEDDTTPVITVVETSPSTETADTNGNNTDTNTDTNETTNNTNTDAASGDTSTVDASNIYATLLGNQAVVAVGGGGGFSNNTGDEIHIDAEKLRESLHARDIYRITIPHSSVLLGSTRNGTFSKEDFTLFVSAALLNDENFRDVDFEDGVLKMRYRALGRLFGFVPLQYTLHVSIEVDSGAVQSVHVKFPWYKFFLATGVSRAALERGLSAEINTRILEQSSDLDVATRAFTSVADTLRERFNFSS